MTNQRRKSKRYTSVCVVPYGHVDIIRIPYTLTSMSQSVRLQSVELMLKAPV